MALRHHLKWITLEGSQDKVASKAEDVVSGVVKKAQEFLSEELEKINDASLKHYVSYKASFMVDDMQYADSDNDYLAQGIRADEEDLAMWRKRFKKESDNEDRNIELHVTQCTDQLMKVARDYIQGVYLPNMAKEFAFEPNEKERKGTEYVLGLLVQDIGTDLLAGNKVEEYLGWFKQKENKLLHGLFGE